MKVNWKFYCFVELLVYTLYLIFFTFFRIRLKFARMPGVCPRCDKNVYFAEEVKALGQVYHKLCFSCSLCRKLLDPGSITEHDGQMFCNSCYR